MDNLTFNAKKVNSGAKVARQKAYSKCFERAFVDKEKIYLPKNPIFETLKQFIFYLLQWRIAVAHFDFEQIIKAPFFVDGIECRAERVDSDFVFKATYNSAKYEICFEVTAAAFEYLNSLSKNQAAFLEKIAIFLLWRIAAGGVENTRGFTDFMATRREAIIFFNENENRNFGKALEAMARFMACIKVTKCFKAACKKGKKKFAAVDFEGVFLTLSTKEKAPRGIVKFGVASVLCAMLSEFKRVAINKGVFSLPPAWMRPLLNCIFKIHGVRKMRYTRYSIQNCLKGSFLGVGEVKNRCSKRQFDFLKALFEYAQKLTDYDFEFEQPPLLKRSKRGRRGVADLMRKGAILIKKRLGLPTAHNGARDLIVDIAAPRGVENQNKVIAIGDFRDPSVNKEIVGRAHTMAHYFEYGRGLDGRAVALSGKDFLKIIAPRPRGAPRIVAPAVDAARVAVGFLAKIKGFVDRGFSFFKRAGGAL